MFLHSKISPAFEPFMADSSRDDKCDAIVIFRPPEPKAPRVRGRLRALKARLDDVRRRAIAQRPVQQKLYKGYLKASGERPGRRKQEMAMASIGRNSLPVTTMEVTRDTLPALAAQDAVVAILPNQKIRLLEPKEVDYDRLGRWETTAKLTWGLKKLGIPEVWQQATGKGVNVAVLDTGVHGEHPALKGRVKQFVVIDPLGRRIEAKPTFDGADHGTHVCGTIAGGKTPEGVSIGVAPEANLLVAGVLVGDATLRTLVEGIAWAVENGADIISMSLGFTYYEPLFVTVFESLLDLDVLPVVAIGNENHGNTSSPGNAHNALSVGALEKMPRGRYDVAPF
ncbi:MAG: S8 family serine peptidase, partial [Planctomycetes bacterium]|nr:S8 family serine peptidase [Planctomycetota bacterium]